jgi:hypothetical protein
MDLLVAGLRLIHIVSAFAWFGLGATLALYVVPAVLAAGESGFRFIKSMFLNTAFARAFPIAAGLTTLAGILLYLVGNSASHFSSTGNIVLGIGAVAGLLAAGHGGMVTGRATATLGEALARSVSDNQPIAGDALTSLREQAAKLASHSRISFYLMVIALLGMASARYL